MLALANSKSLAKLLSSMFDERPRLKTKQNKQTNKIEKENKVRSNRKAVAAPGLHIHMHVRYTHNIPIEKEYDR